MSDLSEVMASLGGSLVGFTGLGSPSLGILDELQARWGEDAVDTTTDIAGWAKYRLQEDFWSAQTDITASIIENRYTAVHSAHDLGKSYTASRIAAWWIDTHPAGEAFVVSTAPTAAQVSAILWREIAKAHRKGALQGRINRAGYPQWYFGSELVGYGRKPADWEESAFQGIHAKYVLVIIDEACGVDQNIYNAVDALVTNEHSRVLAIGNPDIPGSHFQNVCKPDSGWNVIHLDGLRSPNMTRERIIGDDPENPKYPLLAALMEHEGIPYATEPVPDNLRDLLVSELWIEERLRRWGGMASLDVKEYTGKPVELGELVAQRAAQSPLITSKVRGIFPTTSTDGVIPLGWLQLAVNRWHDKLDAPQQDYKKRRRQLRVSETADEPGRKVLGVDVARSGDDDTALVTRYGNLVESIERFHIADTTEVAEWVARKLDEPHSIAVVDVIGIGAGVFDYLRRLKREHKIIGRAVAFNAAGQDFNLTDKTGEFRFRNNRARAWWRLREMLDPSKGSNLAIPDDERLIEELVAVNYKVMTGSIIQIEPKEDIKKRIGRSTDSADALVQAFWVGAEPQVPQAVKYEARSKHRAPQVGLYGQPLPSGVFDPNDFGYEAGTLAPELGIDLENLSPEDWTSW